MATELVSVAGRQARVVQRNVYTGVNNVNAVQVTFEDTGEIRWVAAALLTPVEDVDISLPSAEQEELDEYEAVIGRGLKTFVEVGNALLNIRDKKLYRAVYATFEDYCQQRWDFSSRRAYQLMDAAQVVINIEGDENVKKFSRFAPTVESHTAPLIPLEPEEQRIIWQLVTETAPEGKVTAAHVKSVVNMLTQVGYTGAIDGGEGIDIPIEQATPAHIKAVVTEDTAERMARQQAYIADKQTPREKLFDAKGSLERVVSEFDWMQFERQTAGRIVRLVLYVEECE